MTAENYKKAQEIQQEIMKLEDRLKQIDGYQHNKILSVHIYGFQNDSRTARTETLYDENISHINGTKEVTAHYVETIIDIVKSKIKYLQTEFDKL